MDGGSFEEGVDLRCVGGYSDAVEVWDPNVPTMSGGRMGLCGHLIQASNKSCACPLMPLPSMPLRCPTLPLPFDVPALTTCPLPALPQTFQNLNKLTHTTQNFQSI